MSIWETVGGMLRKTPQHEEQQPTQVETGCTATEPRLRFIDNKDGTVTDSLTGLMWKRCAEGQEWRGGSAQGRPQRFTLIAAKKIQSEFAGYDDWRLPTLNELQSIIDGSRSTQALDENAFSGYSTESPLFWSSTVEGAWYVSFYSGKSFAGVQEATNCVRLVRDSTPSKLITTTPITETPTGSANTTVSHGSDLDFLLRDIERNERPSATLMKSLAWNLGMVNSAGGRLGRTLLHHAAAHRRLEIVKYLCLRHSANINAVDKDGQTPLDYALAVNADEVVDYLRAKGGCTGAELSKTPDHASNRSDLSSPTVSDASLGKPPDLTNRIGADKRFIDHGDGTATDTRTGLMWMRLCEGQNGYGSNSHSEAKALPRDAALNLPAPFAGYLDWRLPTVDELKTLVVKGQGSPCIDSEVFPGTPSRVFWSASCHSKNTERCINFENGNEEVWFETACNYVRRVRGGFSLKFEVAGNGKGQIETDPRQDTYPLGSIISVSAIPAIGSTFCSWSGDANETAEQCTVVMDADKALTATFALESFPLTKAVTGPGSGSITCDPEADSYQFGSKVTLMAKPADGSIFTGWARDATGLDSRCIVEIDSAKHIVAEFQKIEIPDLEVAVSFDSVEQANMKSGDEAFIVYLLIANKGQKQVRIELPFASYMTQQGEEIEQDAWLNGLINGAQGASIRAGAFRKVGLVFFKQKLTSISTGDQLFVSVCQDKPDQRFNYTLRCVDKDAKTFVLIEADVDELTLTETPAVIPEVVGPPADSAEILQRIEMLQTTLDEVLRQLATLKAQPPVIQESAVTPEPAVPVSLQTTQQTLPQVLAWLATQERVSAAALRNLLLPLDLLPGALMDEINERALDRVGEPALEDQDDEILVVQDVLAAILTDWDALNETSNAYEE